MQRLSDETYALASTSLDDVLARSGRSEAAARRGVRVCRVLAGAVVLLAAALRLVRLDLAEFHTDQAGALRRAEDLVRLGRPPLEGAPSSQGLFLEPHFSYLLAPFVAVSRDPALASGAVAATDVAAVGGTLWLGWRVFGPVAGLVAASLYATSPSAVFYGRRIWEPDVHPALAVLLLVALERGVLAGKSWWAAAALPLLLLGAGVHFVFLLLAPLALVAPAALALRRRWLPLAVSVATAVLMVLPLLLHLRATDLQAYRDLRYRASLPARVDLEGLAFVLRAPTGWDAPVAEVLPLADALPSPLAQALPTISLVLLVGAVVLAMGRLVLPGTPRALRARLAGVLAWLLLPAALTARHQPDLHPHYYLVTLPASFLLLGAGAQWLVPILERAARQLVAVGLALLALLVVVNSLAVGRLLDVVANTPQACYGAPLRVDRQAAADLLAFGESSSRVVFENDQLGDASPLAYLVRPGFAALEVARPDLAGLTGPGGPAAGSGVVAAPGRLAASAERLDLAYPNGVRLVRAAVAADPWPGWRPRLALAWRVEPSAGGPVVWEADLVDAAGSTLASEAGQRHAPGSLAGEQVVSWITFDVPPGLAAGDYRARVRLLGGPNLQAVAADTWLNHALHIDASPACVRNVMP